MPQPTLTQLGAAIRNLRQDRAMSIEALGAEAGLHPVSISRIENGKQNASWTVLSSLAEALNVELADLARLAGEQSS